MDLRRRLIGRLGLLLAGLLAATMLVQLSSLRSDIEAEVAASEHLVATLLASSETNPDALAHRLADTDLRHLRIRPAEQALPVATPDAWWRRIVLQPNTSLEREIRIGDRLLIITPKPDSEIDERLGDTVRLLITLLLYSGATLLVAWLVADRALRPVRDLEAGLHRLALGKPDPALPAFALREFTRVAGAINQLAAALQAARGAQRELARQLISLQEDERRALARELHDDMGQSLTALNVTAAHLERNAGKLEAAAIADCAADLRRDIRACGKQLRHMLKVLRPHGLDAAGLSESLLELVEGWRSRETGIEFAIELPGTLPPVDDAGALALYRVVQEALTNVVRHSKARLCKLRLADVGDAVEASISDDGQGLPEQTARRGGLLGMIERLEMVGGSLQLTGGCGENERGLTVIARVPSRLDEG